MRQKIPTAALLSFLLAAFVVLYGCDDGDTGARILPHNPAAAVNGNLPFFTLDANGNPIAVGGTNTNVVTPPAPAAAAFFGTGAGGKRLYLGCPGETTVDGTTVPGGTGYNCDDFVCLKQAQNFLTALNAARPSSPDCHNLDGSPKDGIACNGTNLTATCPAGCDSCQ